MKIDYLYYSDTLLASYDTKQLLFISLKYLDIKKLKMINSIHAIEIIATSNLYSLFIPKIKVMSIKEIRVKMKPTNKVHLIDFSNLLLFEKTGTKARKDNIIKKKPISSSAIKIP
jgi:hypothetical protein